MNRVLAVLGMSGCVLVSAATAAEPDPRWLRIGFYKPSLWGGYVSLVADPNYFLAPSGRRDPEAELAATIREMQRPVEEKHLKAEILQPQENPASTQRDKSKDAHALCRFPARRAYLKETRPELDATFPKIECKRLDNFLQRTNTSKVSLVFSSYYTGNPASSFGHTLLRLHNRRFEKTESELLDTAIGFAAVPTVTNPVLYALYGLAGFFPGAFSAEPYYRKVREYNDQEYRDLWSYQLDLKPKEIERLVGIVWEMGSTYVSYYYFTVNCGTLLLDVLDAAAPRLNVRDRVWFYVLPSDVVHAVNEEPGLVLKRGYRPSVRRQFENRLAKLNDPQREYLDDLIQKEDATPMAKESPESRTQILDTYLDYIEYKHGKAILAQDPKLSELKQKALLLRADLPFSSSVDTSPPPDQAPELAHPVRQFSLGVGYTGLKSAAMINARYRFALHGITNADFGLPQNTELTFFEFGSSLFLGATPRIFLDDFTFFRVTSFNPWSKYEKPLSFTAGIEAATQSDPDFVDPWMGTEYMFATGGGLSLPVFTPKLVLFALGRAKFAASPSYRTSWWRVGLGPQVGLIANFSRKTKLLLEATSLYRLNGDQPWFTTTSGELQYSPVQAWGFFVRFSANSIDQRVLGGFRFLH